MHTTLSELNLFSTLAGSEVWIATTKLFLESCSKLSGGSWPCGL